MPRAHLLCALTSPPRPTPTVTIEMGKREAASRPTIAIEMEEREWRRVKSSIISGSGGGVYYISQPCTDGGGGGGGGGGKAKTSDVSPVYLVAGAGIILAGVAFKGGSWVKDRNRRRRREANMAYGNTGVEMGSPNAGAPMAMATAFSVDGNAGMLAPPTPQGGALAITNGPAAEEPMAASSVQNLTTLLVQAQLARYEPALRGLGVAEPADMEAVDDDTLKSVGLNAIEIARLRRNVTASSQANQLAFMPQVQATATALAPTQQAMPMNKSPAHAKPGKGTRIAPL
mmetsp:Transcript_41171/g.94976  ORF Transcript_41171/g.94976 Transcript_41171/m.94976 type:complete len:287 (-) Transcript_41171:245-1105(-)